MHRAAGDKLCHAPLRPAFGANGSWSAPMYTGRAIEIIAAHNSSTTTTTTTTGDSRDEEAQPLFVYLALQEAHVPLEVRRATGTHACACVCDTRSARLHSQRDEEGPTIVSDARVVRRARESRRV